MTKQLLACGTLLKKHHEDFDIDFREITIKVGSEEVSDFFISRGGVPYGDDDFDVTAMTSIHINNAFHQTVGQIVDRLNGKDAE